MGWGVRVELRARRRTAGKKKHLTALRLRAEQAPFMKKGRKGREVSVKRKRRWPGCAVTSESFTGAIAELDASVVLGDAGRELRIGRGATSTIVILGELSPRSYAPGNGCFPLVTS